jgi:c(7)-type cytochrome triheme protein
MRYQRFIFVTLSILCVTAVFAQTFGTKERMPRPNEFGTVEINNYSENAGIAPVVFAHWLHRAKYTCRLCHVDLGFAMATGQTEIREEDNRNGLYCGACHNGKVAFTVGSGKQDEKQAENCNRCHSLGLDIKPRYDFYKYTKGFPRARFGNRVDWLIAEEEGYFKLVDYLEGVSIKRGALNVPLDVEIEASVKEMPDIIFSHQKHAVWNGCELCHPQIFGVAKSRTVYEMQEIFDGKYCGACHGKVAFMNLDCQLCHTKDVY